MHNKSLKLVPAPFGPTRRSKAAPLSSDVRATKRKVSMPPPRVTKAFVTSQVSSFRGNLDRARDLYRKVVLHGYTGSAAARSTKLKNPDSRDAAQFIFFEVVAKFEEFAKTMFHGRSPVHVDNHSQAKSLCYGGPRPRAQQQIGLG